MLRRGAGRPHSPLLSPVGFDSSDVTHQVLSEADPKNLKREHITLEKTRQEYMLELKKKKKKRAAAVLQGFASCYRLPPLDGSDDTKSDPDILLVLGKHLISNALFV